MARDLPEETLLVDPSSTYPPGSVLGSCLHILHVCAFRCDWMDGELLAGEATLKFSPGSDVVVWRPPCLGQAGRKSQGPVGWVLRSQAAWFHAARPPPFRSHPPAEGRCHCPCHLVLGWAASGPVLARIPPATAADRIITHHPHPSILRPAIPRERPPRRRPPNCGGFLPPDRAQTPGTATPNNCTVYSIAHRRPRIHRSGFPPQIDPSTAALQSNPRPAAVLGCCCRRHCCCCCCHSAAAHIHCTSLRR